MWSSGYQAWIWSWQQFQTSLQNSCESFPVFSVGLSDLTTRAKHFSLTNSTPADDTDLQKILIKTEFLGAIVGIVMPKWNMF